MIVTSSNLVHYLIERRLVSRDSVVDGDWQVVDTSRRNRNFKVIRKNHPSYFVKQIKSWEPQAIAGLKCEALCYWLANNDADFAALAPLLPRSYGYDPSFHVLVVELLPEGENLSEYHRRVGKFPPNVAGRLGRLLGIYHRDAGTRSRTQSGNALFSRNIPWILSVHNQAAYLFQTLSAANSQLLQIVQRYPEFRQTLDALRGRWQATALIHGDMKWDNCIVRFNHGAEEDFDLKIVDWELADFGDPCWDAGAVFQAYLSFWILALPIAADASPGQLVQQAPYPLEAMQPALKAFWQAYLTTRQIYGPADQELLERCVLYGAARMVQTAYEHMSYATQISATALYLLQVSLNILANPREAIRSLLDL